jgi:Fic family protein
VKVQDFSETALRQDFTRRVQRARSSVLLNRLIDLFFEHPIMFVPAIARQLDISYNAAKNNLKRLAEEGIVKEDRFKGRKFWIAQDILSVTTDDKADA